MYRLALVDDETGALSILQGIIKKLAPDFEVLPFDCPHELLTFLKQHCIHALLCDIRMDDLNGLDVCRIVHERYPRVILGIISAYSDFTYAQVAIDIGVTAYLTKPVSREKITVLIKRIRQQLEAEQSNSGEGWLSFLTDDSGCLPYPFHTPCGRDTPANLGLIALPDDCCPSSALSQAALQAAFPEFIPYSSLVRLDGRCAAIVIFGSTKLFYKRMDTMLEQLQHLYRSGHHAVVVRASALPILTSDASAWRLAYAQCVIMLESCFSYAKPQCMTPEKFQRLQPPPQRLFEDLETDILLSLRKQDESRIHKLLEQFLLRIEQEHWSVSSGVYRENFKHLLISAHRIAGLSFTPQQAAIIDSTFCLAETIQCVDKQVDAIVRQYLRHINTASDGLAQRMISYVEEHCCEELSLESVADTFHLSANYLSCLFKEQARLGFREFIINCRIEHAKRLLLTTDLKVYEISARVGYADTTSFVKLFKREVGISPARYRRME